MSDKLRVSAMAGNSIVPCFVREIDVQTGRKNAVRGWSKLSRFTSHSQAVRPILPVSFAFGTNKAHNNNHNKKNNSTKTTTEKHDRHCVASALGIRDKDLQLEEIPKCSSDEEESD